MAHVPESAESQPSTVAIILRAARLGLFTEAEAGQLIDRVRPDTTTTSPVSIPDRMPTGAGEQIGSLPIGPDRTFS